MARAPFLMPTVFVGCPYGKPFDFLTFRDTLAKLPVAWYYADTHLNSKHLLSILTTYVKAVEYCLFDLSFWNPNVSLELGLAEGLGTEYYILVNGKHSRDVPSDIKGIQRIEYAQMDYGPNGLIPNIVRYLIKEQTHPRNIWQKLGSENREKKFYFALAVLAHFRENKRLSDENVAQLSKGLYLRKEVQREVLTLLGDLGYLSALTSKQGAKLEKRIYPPELRLK